MCVFCLFAWLLFFLMIHSNSSVLFFPLEAKALLLQKTQKMGERRTPCWCQGDGLKLRRGKELLLWVADLGRASITRGT